MQIKIMDYFWTAICPSVKFLFEKNFHFHILDKLEDKNKRFLNVCCINNAIISL